MGTNLQWTGLMIVVVGGQRVPHAYEVGGIIWLIGNILTWMGK